jgi:hypothetical protein
MFDDTGGIFPAGPSRWWSSCPPFTTHRQSWQLAPLDGSLNLACDFWVDGYGNCSLSISRGRLSETSQKFHRTQIHTNTFSIFD